MPQEAHRISRSSPRSASSSSCSSSGSARCRADAPPPALTLAISHASVIALHPRDGPRARALSIATGGDFHRVFALFLGVSMSVTAFPVLARILIDRRINTPLGVIAIRVRRRGRCDGVVPAGTGCRRSRRRSWWSAATTFGWSLFYVAVMFVAVRPMARSLAAGKRGLGAGFTDGARGRHRAHVVLGGGDRTHRHPRAVWRVLSSARSSRTTAPARGLRARVKTSSSCCCSRSSSRSPACAPRSGCSGARLDWMFCGADHRGGDARKVRRQLHRGAAERARLARVERDRRPHEHPRA